MALVLFAVFLAAFAATGWPTHEAQAQVTGAPPGQSLGTESDSDMWRRVRRGDTFNLTGTGMGTPVLIQSKGESWRALRNGPISFWGGWLIVASVVVTVLFFLVKGRINIEGGRSGTILQRFTDAERMVHWFVAVLFVLLALSGLSVMFGKYVLIPVMGKSAFATLANASVQVHGLLGPLFVIGVLAMIVLYMKDNWPRYVDLVWIAKGGIFMGQHASSWKYNGAEKIWFWLVVVGGIALSGSGLLLDFPVLTANPEQLQLSNIVHGISAAALIAGAIMHIYLGTIGVEGALESMWTGEVDENWAKEHHDLWAIEVTEGREAAEIAEAIADGTAPGVARANVD